MTDSTTTISTKQGEKDGASADEFAETTDVEGTAVKTTERASRKPLRGGWRIIASKELADHLVSIRFAILVVLIALIGLAVINSVASEIRTAAQALSEQSSVFLLLYTTPGEQIPWSFVDLVGFLAPLLGLVFGFTAINSERANRTLPRLVSQPIYRDDVVTGKFAAGLTLIALTVAALVALLAGYGMIQLGIGPSPGDVGRLVAFAVVVMLYIGVWLALGIMLSVLSRSAVTAVLAGLVLWLVLTLFLPLISQPVANFFSPIDENSSGEELLNNLNTERRVQLVSPQGYYNEATTLLLNPQIRSAGVPTLNQLAQGDRAVPGAPLDFDQSLLVVWPQIVALLAIMVVLFAISFIKFLDQEIRA